MEGIDIIEKEIQEKVIEKEQSLVEDKPPHSVSVEKKPRSEAQKAAFEKARAKRAENLKNKELKINPDTLEVASEVSVAPKKKRGRPRGSTKAKQLEKPRLPEPVNNPVYQPVNHNIPVHQPAPQNYYQYDPRAFQPPPTPQPAPVNNYYYYGTPPPQDKEEPRSILKKQPLSAKQESSSEEEEYEESGDYGNYGNPEYIQDTYQPPPEPKLKFRFA